jgi:hypothetical protein
MLIVTAQPQTEPKSVTFYHARENKCGFADWLASSKGLLDPPEVPLPDRWVLISKF